MKIDEGERFVGWRQIPLRKVVHFFERHPHSTFVNAVCHQCAGYAEPQLAIKEGARQCQLCIMEILMMQPPFRRWHIGDDGQIIPDGRGEERRRRWQLYQNGKLPLIIPEIHEQERRGR